jgi:ribosome-associated translation inhibitor RaiA
MAEAVRLGGNIELYGVETIDHATMIVLKKIIGNYARKFSERGLEKLAISFAHPEVNIEAVAQGNTVSAQATHSNIFFGVDAALKEIDRQL